MKKFSSPLVLMIKTMKKDLWIFWLGQCAYNLEIHVRTTLDDVFLQQANLFTTIHVGNLANGVMVTLNDKHFSLTKGGKHTIEWTGSYPWFTKKSPPPSHREKKIATFYSVRNIPKSQTRFLTYGLLYSICLLQLQLIMPLTSLRGWWSLIH